MPETDITSPKIPKFNVPKGSLGLKLILVCALVILMAIPAMFVSRVSYERSDRANEVTAEVSKRYGGEQYISGPILVAPYSQFDADGNFAESGNYAVFANKGHAEFANIKTQIRKRSLFKVPTFQGEGVLTGQFDSPARLDKEMTIDIDWSKAKIMVALSDVRGLKSDVVMTMPDGQTRTFQPASFDDLVRRVEVPQVVGQTVRTNRVTRSYGWLNQSKVQSYLSVDASDLVETTEGFTVKIDLNISGARRLGITPFAQSTTVNLASDWSDPGFEGGFAPDERAIGDAGFSADWSVPYLRRGIRAHGKGQNLGPLFSQDKVMTVQFVSTDNPYQTVNRALKYAVMFIGLVFLAYFLFEIIVGVRVHPAQYILIGLAQSIFYLLLLAFAERIGFTGAFILAAGLTITATAGYAGAVFGDRKYIARAGSVFLMVYGLLYALMRMQDFALMIGALASFTAIAGTMYLTRKMDWYDLQQAAIPAVRKSVA